jgi:hypothetical protein
VSPRAVKPVKLRKFQHRLYPADGSSFTSTGTPQSLVDFRLLPFITDPYLRSRSTHGWDDRRPGRSSGEGRVGGSPEQKCDVSHARRASKVFEYRCYVRVRISRLNEKRERKEKEK